MEGKSNTPKTDAQAKTSWEGHLAHYTTVPTDFARTLERELAAVTAERDAARAEVEEQARVNGMGMQREARLIAERDALRKWRTALEEACVNACLDIPDDPVKAIKMLVEWECSIALDPAVSTDAQRLRDTYKAERDALRKEVERLTPKQKQQPCGARLAPGQYFVICGEVAQGSEGNPVAWCSVCRPAAGLLREGATPEEVRRHMEAYATAASPP